MPKTNYPKEFVENILVVNVNALNLILDNFVQVNFNLLDVGIKQRPSANGLRYSSFTPPLNCVRHSTPMFSFTTTVDSVQMMGYDQPLIEMLDPSNKWLDFSLQLKPVDDPATDQSIKLRMAPVLMKYSASAVNRIVNVFKPPESVKLHQYTF